MSTPAQVAQQERWQMSASNKGRRAWNELSLEDKRTHRRKVNLFQKHIYEQHIFQGVTPQELAEKYNVSRTYIVQHLQAFIKKKAKKQEIDIPAERLDQYNKLKNLLDVTYQRALSGNDFAIKSYVSLSARFSKVIGLDAPTRFQHEVNKKVQHEHTHTVDIEDIARRVELVRQRQAMLSLKPAVAAPISDLKTTEKDPVLAESFSSAQESGSIGDEDDQSEIMEAEYSVEVPELLKPEEPTLKPVPDVPETPVERIAEPWPAKK